ncbi:hypothetical protein BGV40_11035 [Methanosarcina sp. Ant1]|nr:hypothetical protein BGV40_11035 [Methanosarcina sp. Ant1]
MALEQKLKQLQVKINQNPLTSATILIAVLLLLLIVVPYADISLRGINNSTVQATLENQSRATLAQIFGGVAIAIGLYYTWRRIAISEKELKATQKNLAITQKNLKVAQESQITERFTRAVDQLGNPAMEIRLGGIYALERIANESENDYWPIMEILTAYVRENSPVKAEIPEMDTKVKVDIQAILTIIGRRKYTKIENASDIIDLRNTYLREAYLPNAPNLKKVYFARVDLKGANLSGANFEGAYLGDAKLNGAILIRACLKEANLTGADLQGAILKDANLEKANLKKAKNINIYQLNTAKTLQDIELDEQLEKQLKNKFPHWFEKPKDEP